MSFVAATECTLPVPVEVAFDRLADHASWRTWMPRSFRPVGSSGGVLRVGDRLRVRIAGSPVSTPIVVRVMRRPHEIMWTGGVRGVLYAEHHFFFEEEDGGVRVRSVENWTGALTLVARRVVLPMAQTLGGEQLTSLARAVAS
jgi:hypothetical protein